MIRERGWPMVMNVVIHRLNIGQIGRIIEMADELGAEYLELANAQYYSWALLNREQLMPSREQLRAAEAVTDEWKAKLADRMRILFVVPDYHEGKPKKCMNDWGNVFLTVTPDGTALPCHTARMLPGLSFPNVADSSLRDIWYDSSGFNRYRGTGWMKQPCRDCEHKEEDLGGCRCQAYLLAGDPDAADPVCPKSPHHEQVAAALLNAENAAAQGKPLIFREPKESRQRIEQGTA
jgi:pyrroloquinoline quinone biosynthesis protein E